MRDKTVSDPEAEVTLLRMRLAERDAIVEELQRQVVELKERLAEQPQRPSQKNDMDEEEVQSGDCPAPLEESPELLLLRQTIADQRRETDELQASMRELSATNADLEARLAELEQMRLVESAAAAILGPQTPRDFIDQAPLDSFSSHRPFKVQVQKDIVDQRLQEYLTTRPDFALDIQKVKPGWYVFGEPVSKKLFLKVVGDHVVCRVGGGHKDLFKFLDDHRFTDHRVEVEIQAMRARSRQRRQEKERCLPMR